MPRTRNLKGTTRFGAPNIPLVPKRGAILAAIKAQKGTRSVGVEPRQRKKQTEAHKRSVQNARLREFLTQNPLTVDPASAARSKKAGDEYAVLKRKQARLKSARSRNATLSGQPPRRKSLSRRAPTTMRAAIRSAAAAGPSPARRARAVGRRYATPATTARPRTRVRPKVAPRARPKVAPRARPKKTTRY